MIWLRRARGRHVGLLWKLWALLFAFLIVGIFVAAASMPTRAMHVQHAPAEWQIAYWRAAVALALAEHAPYITAEIPTLPPLIRVHGGMDWPAQFKNVDGTPCCTLHKVYGDCVRVSQETAIDLREGSTITLDYPSGRITTRINAVYDGPEPAVCSTGCAFRKPAGV